MVIKGIFILKIYFLDAFLYAMETHTNVNKFIMCRSNVKSRRSLFVMQIIIIFNDKKIPPKMWFSPKQDQNYLCKYNHKMLTQKCTR